MKNMHAATITLHNVDTELLEKQRMKLVELLFNKDSMTPEHMEALQGVIHMLDDWSDNNRRIDHDK